MMNIDFICLWRLGKSFLSNCITDSHGELQVRGEICDVYIDLNIHSINCEGLGSSVYHFS